jgi:phosphoenolpyruvate-protein kinase (PTS system EI component)
MHLAEYRRQNKAMLDDFFSTLRAQSEEFKTANEKNGQTIQQAVMHIKLQIVDAELVARRVKLQMEHAECEWENIKTSTMAHCKRLEEVSNDLRDRFAWRVIIWWMVGLSVAFGLGYCSGHLWIR